MKKYLYLIIFVSLFYSGCKERDVPFSKPLRELMTRKSVLIENGQSGIIKTNGMYYLVVPFKNNVDFGSYKIYESETLAFNDKSRLITHKDNVLLAEVEFKIGDISYLLNGGSKDTTYLTLLSEDTKSEVALSYIEFPNTKDVSSLEWKRNLTHDETYAIIKSDDKMRKEMDDAMRGMIDWDKYGAEQGGGDDGEQFPISAKYQKIETH